MSPIDRTPHTYSPPWHCPGSSPGQPQSVTPSTAVSRPPGPKVTASDPVKRSSSPRTAEYMWARYFRQIFRSYNFLPKCLENQHYGEIFLGSWRCLYIFSKLLRYSLIFFLLYSSLYFVENLFSPNICLTHQAHREQAASRLPAKAAGRRLILISLSFTLYTLV